MTETDREMGWRPCGWDCVVVEFSSMIDGQAVPMCG